MKTLNYSLLIFILALISCNNDEQELPTGNHSFYCYIDGELFVPKGNTNIASTSPANDGLNILNYDDSFNINANDYRKYTIMFNIANWAEGTFSLSECDGNFYNYSINHAIVRINGVTYLSKENSGTITFTENTQNNVKGTFEFTLYNENNDSDVIHVTNGHFDD